MLHILLSGRHLQLRMPISLRTADSMETQEVAEVFRENPRIQSHPQKLCGLWKAPNLSEPHTLHAKWSP